MVAVEDDKQISHYSFRTEKQAKKFAEGIKIGTTFKVAIYISIKKAGVSK